MQQKENLKGEETVLMTLEEIPKLPEELHIVDIGKDLLHQFSKKKVTTFCLHFAPDFRMLTICAEVHVIFIFRLLGLARLI